jgi:hypothetical protein
MNVKLIIAASSVFSMLSFESIATIVINFDDLASETLVTGSGYAGLDWEYGNAGYNGNQGAWVVPPVGDDNHPKSEPRNVVNAWGCTLLGIQLPQNVNVLGAYFGSQGSGSAITTGVRVHGFLNGSQTGMTDWFTDIDTHPDWFAMNLNNVDRIVIESVPTINGGGWYGMDDFTYQVVPEPASMALIGLFAAGIWVKRRFFID